MNRSPAFQFYPDKWQSHTRRLSPEAYRVFHELLCWMWQHSPDYYSIDASPSAVACAVAMPLATVTAALQEIQNPFSPLLKEEGGRWICNGLKKESEKQANRRSFASKAGQASAKTRSTVVQRTLPQTPTDVAPNPNGRCEKFNSPSPSPSPSLTNTTPDTSDALLPVVPAAPVLKIPKPKEPPKEPPNKEHHQFIAEWCAAHLETLGRSYIMDGGRDGKAVKRLLATKLLTSELLAIARQAWKSAGWNCKQAVTLHGFADRLNEIRHELSNKGLSVGQAAFHAKAELDRVEKRLAQVRCVDSHNDLGAKERAEIKTLRARAEQLKRELGFII